MNGRTYYEPGNFFVRNEAFVIIDLDRVVVVLLAMEVVTDTLAPTGADSVLPIHKILFTLCSD